MRKYLSPDRSQSVAAVYVGNNSFGNPSYQIRFNQEKFLPFNFSDTVCWSEDSRYCAIKGWMSGNSASSSLTIFDRWRKQHAVIKKEGEFKDISFSKGCFFFTVKLHGFLIRYKLTLAKLNTWENSFGESAAK